MATEEQELLLSAYVDGELTPEEQSRIEALLETDVALQIQLDNFMFAKHAIHDELNALADEQDYSAMEISVLAEVMNRPKVVDTESSFERFWNNFTAQLRQIVRRPVVSFALGACATVLVLNVLPTSSPAPDETGTVVAQNQPDNILRQPEVETSLHNVEASLVVETISSKNGRVEVRTRADDPDAPSVIWYSSDSTSGKRRRGVEEPNRTENRENNPTTGNPL
jgi:anti-sigma factor RsiW